MLVRNIKYAFKKDHNVYIGWGEKARGIARSPLAPPYDMRLLYRGPDAEKENAERKAMLAAYKVWLWKKMQDDDPAVWQALHSITANSVLLCHCHPKACHGHVVRDAWTWAYKNGKIDQPKPITTLSKRPLQTPAPEVHVPISPALIDAKLDEELLQSNALARSLPPKKKQGRGAPRMLPALRPPAPDPIYNRMDDIAADLAEMAFCLGPHAHMAPGMIDYLALTPEEQAARDAAFDRAEEAYEARQLALAAA